VGEIGDSSKITNNNIHQIEKLAKLTNPNYTELLRFANLEESKGKDLMDTLFFIDVVDDCNNPKAFIREATCQIVLDQLLTSKNDTYKDYILDKYNMTPEQSKQKLINIYVYIEQSKDTTVPELTEEKKKEYNKLFDFISTKPVNIQEYDKRYKLTLNFVPEKQSPSK